VPDHALRHTGRSGLIESCDAHLVDAEPHTREPRGVECDEAHVGDAAVVAHARRQHGVVTTAQLVDAGLGRGAIARRVQRGWLVPLFRGVYQVGPVVAPQAREMAAVLACGPTAALSHHTAAALWSIRLHTGAIHVTVTGHQPRNKPGLRIHRSHSLNAAVLHGLPLTTPTRTLIDLAPHLRQHELDRATEQVQVLKLATRDEIAAQLDKQRGVKALRAALFDEPALTRSEAERRLLDLVREAGLPRPETNVKVDGCEVDLLWRAQRLIVEVDGYAFHGGRAAFERDRRRDAALQAAGYRVVRFTWRQITGEPHAVVARLATLLMRQVS
jgi:very-short-patch-repair endonuclease